MEITSIRERPYSLIDNSDEKRLLEIYSILESDYTDEFKRILDEEFDACKKDQETISKEDLDKTIAELLSFHTESPERDFV